MWKNFMLIFLVMQYNLLCFSQNRSVVFEIPKFADAINKAKKEQKLIFLDLYTSWCVPCKKLAKEVFTNDTVADFFNTEFVNISFDAEKSKEGKYLAEKYFIGKYPSLLFIDTNGNVLNYCNFCSPTELIDNAKTAQKSNWKFSNDLKKYNDGERSWDFMMDFYKTTSLLGFNYDKEFADYLLSFNREELMSHKNWISFYYNIYQKHFVIYAKYLLEEKKLIEIIGKEKFETVKDSAFKNLYKILKYDPENFKQTEEEAKMFLLNEADIMESFNFFTSYNWLATIEEKARGKYRNDEWILQSYAFTIINETRNSDTLKIAMDLIKQSINIKENAENLDTYAILLYTEGKKDEAIKTEERAVSISDRDDLKKIYKKTIKLFINNEPIEKILGRYDN